MWNWTLLLIYILMKSQQLHYYTFVVKLDKYVGSCYTLNDPPNKVCVQNTAED